MLISATLPPRRRAGSTRQDECAVSPKVRVKTVGRQPSLGSSKAGLRVAGTSALGRAGQFAKAIHVLQRRSPRARRGRWQAQPHQTARLAVPGDLRLTITVQLTELVPVE